MAVKGHYYSRHVGSFHGDLATAIDRQVLRELHRKVPARHLLVSARQFALLGLCTWGLVRFDHPAVWIPLAIVQGFTVFNFTVLLHEVVHHAVFERRRAVAERVLAWLYAVPSGISASQFTRWHLDHHAELGSERGRPQAAPPVPEGERALVQAALLLPRAVSRSTSGPRAANRPPTRRISSAGSRANAGWRWPSTSRRSSASGSSPAGRRRCGRTSSRSSSCSRSRSR